MGKDIILINSNFVRTFWRHINEFINPRSGKGKIRSGLIFYKKVRCQYYSNQDDLLIHDREKQI